MTKSQHMFTTYKYRGTNEYTEVFERLKQIASNRRRTDYAAIFAIMKLKPGHHAAREAGHLLGEISAETHKVGKPMLSAIVVNQTGRPGKGFYELAIRLGKLAPGATNEDKENFWKREVNAVFATTW